MDYLTAFSKIWISEGNAGRAALVLSWAVVIQLVGWEGMNQSDNKVNDLRRAFKRASVDPLSIRFFHDDDPRINGSVALTMAEIEEMRREQEQELGTVACNMHGHMYKKTEWQDRMVGEPQHDGRDEHSSST